MQLSLLVAEIQDELNKGAAITAAQIRLKVQAALSTIELMRDWTYMHVNEEAFSIVANTRTIALPTGFKSFSGVRFVESDGSRVEIDEVDPDEITTVDIASPQAYIKSGTASIILDNTPDQSYQGYWDYYKFTTWSDADNFEPWPFIHIKPMVYYQSLVMLSPFAREPNLMTMWAQLLAQATKTAVDADDEFKLGNKPRKMKYKG